MGTTCCASTAEAIIAQELTMLPGITDVAVDLPSAMVNVVYDARTVSDNDIATALEEIGYPGTRVQST